MATRMRISLNKMMLGGMAPEERKYWEDFLKLAKRTMEAISDDKPMVAPDDFVAVFNDAVASHGGARYCQVQQLSWIFRNLPLEEEEETPAETCMREGLGFG